MAAAGISLAPGLGGFLSPLKGNDLFAQLPAVPYGAVYFRKSFPPKEDWETDYREAAKIGINSFRHWFMWSAIEVKPGVYDWEDYDRQMDLSAKYGIKSIIADILCTAPEWAFSEFPHAMMEDIEGHKAHSAYTVACAVGGWPGLCLDHEDVRERAEAFLKALVTRYKDHPGLGGYDTFNEQNHFADAGGCWCDESAKKFRQWLKKKYGDLDTLARAWNRYSYRDWDDIEIPRHQSFYGDAIDWVLFRTDNAYRLMKWRVDTIKAIDPDHPVTAHGIPQKSLKYVGPDTYNGFKAGKLVDGFGHSGGCNHQEWTKYRWEHWLISDLTRANSYGKPFWNAEMPSGYSWRMHGTSWEKGRMATPQDIRLYSMTSFAGGATGVYSPRWRPLLNGWHVGNFAYCNMDGSHTDRSAMGGEMAAWANHPDQEKLWKARPVKGEVGIVVVPESADPMLAAGRGYTSYYNHAITGAYQGFLFNNVQADFVYSEEINDDYGVLYLPHPLMLPGKVVSALKNYVENGGILISEGCPAYYGDHGRAGETQPNYGLDKLFGAAEARVEFTPRLLEEMKFNADGRKVSGGVYLQAYKPTSGSVSGTFDDGLPAIVDHVYGIGKTRLVGTSPGYGYYEAKDDPGTRAFFGKLLSWAGKDQHVRCSDHRLVARIHRGKGYHVLWIVNSTHDEIAADLTLSGRWANTRNTWWS